MEPVVQARRMASSMNLGEVVGFVVEIGAVELVRK